MYRSFLILAFAAVMPGTVHAAGLCPDLTPSTPDVALTDNGDGTVTHTLTGLMWKQCPEGMTSTVTACDSGNATTQTWGGALGAARSATFAGYTDWRVPNKKELESIVESCLYNPAIHPTLFPGTGSSGFWTGSSYDPSPDMAWVVNFYNGASTLAPKTSAYLLRLVRAGRVESSFDAQPDTTPNVFSFTPQTGVALSTLVVSNAIMVSGMTASATVSVSGGSYSINGGAYGTADGTAANGDTITVAQTSSSSNSTTTSAILTIGGVSGTFDVTTEGPAAITTPDPFAFTAQTDVPLSTDITSNPITVSGINIPVKITVLGGSYSVNGGAFTTHSGLVVAGDSVRVRQTSSSAPMTTTSVVLRIGGGDGSFDVTTTATPQTVYTGPTGTGNGLATATLSGGGAKCGFTRARFVPLSGTLANTAPTGVTFPYGLFSFALGACAPGSSVTISIAYPGALPSGTQYWKFGPTPGNDVPHWYTLPASVSGNLATFSIVDGGPGDDDLVADGSISDDGGPGVGATVAAVPANTPFALALLALAMTMLGLGALAPKRSASRT